MIKNKRFKISKISSIILYLIFFFIFSIGLSLLRDATGDETYYLQETMLIVELFEKGLWIGNFGVGLHGFLFKIPVALIFLVLGKPSVFVATLFTIILGVSSVYLFYKILKKYFLNKKFSLLSTILFSLTLYFISTTISFNRDIPAILMVLVFFYLFLNKSNKWWIALSLLLMLDAKEHVFLTVAPLYGLYLIIVGIQSIKKQGRFESIKKTLKDIFIVYIFPVVWIVLMFTTSFVPVNMFIASIGGLVTSGYDWNESQFTPAIASSNLLEGEGKQMIQIADVVVTGCGMNEEALGEEGAVCSKSCEGLDLKCRSFDLIDTILSYIGKILYPRTFSFISIPKIIVLPALVVAFKQFLVWWKKRDRKYLLPMILFFNVLILVLRASHGRYLLCVSPLLMLFFIMFIKDFYKSIKFSRTVLIYTTIFVLLGLYFESTFLLPKTILELGLLIVFWSLYVFRNQVEKTKAFLKILFVSLLALGMLLTQLAFSYSIGQIGNYLKYGYNRESLQMSEKFNEEVVIWVNEYGSTNLLRVHRNDLSINPEWNWQLTEWLPKERFLATVSEKRTFSFPVVSIEAFKENIQIKEIERVVLVISIFEEDPFLEQDYLEEFKELEWLRLDEEVLLQNKMIYIFYVEI